MKIKCEYCGVEQEKQITCKCCGASMPEDISQKCGPFYFRGFIVWPERILARDEIVYHFYLGERRIYALCFSVSALYDLIPEGRDPAPYVYDLMKLTIGEAECLRIEQQNRNKDVLLEVRRIEREKMPTVSDIALFDMLSEYGV